jgi:transcriptional regulator with XRE-family HTH domain
MAISHDEREFFSALGRRIAQQRKDSHITQVHLAETLGVSQPTINAYEPGQRRVPVVLARVLGLGLEELLAESPAATKMRDPPLSYKSRWSVSASCPNYGNVL